MKDIIREFKLSSLAVDNRTSVFVLGFIILILGVFSYSNMPKENYPEIIIPTIYVGTTYPGNSPVDIENLITRPIEKELKGLSGIKNIKSTSIQDYSTIIVEFNTNVEVSKALQEVKDAVDKAKPDLPNDLDREPNIFEMNFSEIPIMNINLSGDYNMDHLKDFAEYLQDEIEKLSEISKVEIKGAVDKEIAITVDVNKMTSMRVSFGSIEGAIAQENITMSGGDILSDGFRRTVRVVGEFKSAEEIGNIIVKNANQDVVFLRDIADVEFGYVERESYARSIGDPVISLDVKKRSGENLIEAASKIKKIIAETQANRFPEDLNVTITNDQSRITIQQVDNLENSIISGVILVVVVLLFFLGLRNALFVGIAIPMSMLMGFMILSFLGITMNVVVLFSLILALGMLVDNGIVVVENVYRLMQEGHSHIRAAKEGVGEVALPIITSTATTLAAFLPLIFWYDIMGEFMKYLPITLIIVLTSSLFVALVINPVLTSVFMKVETQKQKIKIRRQLITLGILAAISLIGVAAGSKVIRNLPLFIIAIILINNYLLRPASFWFQSHMLVRLEDAYNKVIHFALSGIRPYLFLGGTVFLLFFSIYYFFAVKSPMINLFPENEPNYINIFVETPIGTDIEVTNEITKKIEGKVFESLNKYAEDSIVESIIVNVGEGTADQNAGPQMGVTPNKAKITVSFVEFQYRNGISTSDVMEEIRDDISGFPGVLINIDKELAGPPVGKPINIEVSGEDYEKLIKLAEEIRSYIKKQDIPGIEELKLDLETGKPELLVDVDRDAARRYGASTAQIASSIRTALFGKELSKFKVGEDDYPIYVRLDSTQRYDISSLLNQRLTFKDNATGDNIHIPISSVADVRYSSTFGSIKRIDLDRVITIYSNVMEGYNANDINARIQDIMEDYSIPSGYSVKYTGEQEQQQETMEFLMSAMVIAVFLILLIIVAQFNSLITPFIIMASVLFSTIGVFLGLSVFNMEFIVMMTGIGIISLAGIVVNNAIVLMDYTNLLRERRRTELGLDHDRLPDKEIIEMIMQGGKTRLRPVLLTAITTILGLVPLAVGLNIDFFGLIRDFDPNIYVGGDNVRFWGPMSWTIIFGLTFSTFLTLVIVPVMYLLTDRAKNWAHRILVAED